uniref:Uncharacterized protein n=1 Tax=Arundo donax TaxID=35708 RepID=A0A0A9AGN7_ARUDO
MLAMASPRVCASTVASWDLTLSSSHLSLSRRLLLLPFLINALLLFLEGGGLPLTSQLASCMHAPRNVMSSTYASC